MRNNNHILLTILSLCVMLSLCACNSSTTSELDGWTPHISRGLHVHLEQNNAGGSSDLVYVYFSPNDGSQDFSHEQWLTKLEADYGDGSGWQDITAWYRIQAERQTVTHYLIDSITHTYPSAGTYLLNGRVTYWDGAVVYLTNSQGMVQPVSVTVP